jgi:transposase-like protein
MMVESPKSKKVLDQVWWRLWFARTASRTFWAFVVFTAMYAVALLTTRLTGLIPDVFEAWTLALPAGLALLVGLAWPSRPTTQQAARSIDAAQNTRDLFLTLTMLRTTAGEYQPLVVTDAEQAAAKVNPSLAVPFTWEQRALATAAVLAILFCGQVFLPTLDPFGKVAQAKQEETNEKKLAEKKKETEIRKAQLKEKELENALSPDVEKAITGLMTSLRAMKKDQPKKNYESLVANQKNLGDKFRATNEALKTLMSKSSLEQKFGSQNANELKRWTESLQNGSSEELAKEMEKLKEDLELLQKTDDPVAKTEMERKIEKRLKAMADLATDQVGSKSLQAAIQRAKDQLEAAKSDGKMSMEEKQALQESLDVAKMELQQIAQSARDLKALEESLQAISDAKRLNGEGQLDGAMTDALTAMEQYKELYEELLAQMGADPEAEGDGEGTGGRGQGGGGKVDEDDKVETGFVSEKTPTPIQKGKILMSMKSKGLGDESNEDLKLEYKAALDSVKQGYAEAIEAEQIPPGYRGSIQSYFDSLGKTPDQKK